MYVSFSGDDLSARRRCLFKDEKGELLYWGIYDFAYKYRDRIYDPSDNEVAYVQKNIAEEDLVEFFDGNDHKLGELRGRHPYAPSDLEVYFDDEKYTADLPEPGEGSLEVTGEDTLLKSIMILYGMIEIRR